MPPLNVPGDLYAWLTASPLSRPTHSPSPDSVNLPDLRAHRTLGHDLVVHVQLGRADGLVVLPGLLSRELHAERVLAGLQLRTDELLLRRDAEEVVDVVQLLVLDEQRVPAEA